VVQALIAYVFFLTVSAVILTVFWGLQIRYGNLSGLNPNSFVVRLFARKSTPKPSQLEYGSMSPAVAGLILEPKRQAGMAPIPFLVGALALNVQFFPEHNSASQTPSISMEGRQSAGSESMAEPYVFTRD
jgi:hypothetical protein